MRTLTLTLLLTSEHFQLDGRPAASSPLADEIWLDTTIIRDSHSLLFCTKANNILLGMEGQWTDYFPHTGKLVKWKSGMVWISNKQMNKNIKIVNGNRDIRNVLKVSHWNMGKTLWENKLDEVDALILDKTSDLLFITEANLMKSLPVHLRQVKGYTLHLPLTMDTHNYAIILLLVRNGVEVKIHQELMHEGCCLHLGKCKNWKEKCHEDWWSLL